MKPTREFWRRWAESLRRYQLQHLAALLIEGGRPLALVGAQALYFGEGFVKSEQLSALANLLEDDQEMRAFADFLNNGADA